MKRRPGLVIVGLLIVAAVGAALWFALAGPASRAGDVASAFAALASTLAALAAIYLSREALARTDEQLASARMATILSRYPLLLPIHQSVAFPDSSGRMNFHPPSEDRFELKSASAGCYAFVEDTAKDKFIIPVENAGEGPALGITGRLWRNDGALGEVTGPATLATNCTAIMTAQLQGAGTDLPEAFKNEIHRVGDRTRSTYFWLDLSYFDVFNNARSARAMFDPHGMGAWHHCYEPTVKAGDQDAELSAATPAPRAAGGPTAGAMTGESAGSPGGAIRMLLLTRHRRAATFNGEGEKVDVQGVNKG